MNPKGLLREPLLHFLLIGAALFAWFEWRSGGGGPTSTRIVLSSGQIEHLAASFVRTWQRPASEEELKGLIDEWVREEIAVREAMAAGLDRDDTVIRRRLRQKFEFLLEEFATAAPPTEAELAAWLAEHAEQYRQEPQIAFRQLFLSRERRGAAADADARALLARLAAGDRGAELAGDSTLLPEEIALATSSEIARQFGEPFAAALARLAPGAWAGPLESSYGLHLVRVSERGEAAAPELAAIRPAVERDYLADRQRRQLEEVYRRLLEKYTVVVEPRAEAPSNAGAAGGGS